MRNIVIFFIITILTCSRGIAQSDFALAQAPPPTPTAYELGKYGNIPISHHTGTAQISIPIYNLEIADISLPITLDYHSSGIRVDDIASWVGLGWSLNAGGCITVSINGRADLPKLAKSGEIPYPFRIRAMTSSDLYNKQNTFSHDELNYLAYSPFYSRHPFYDAEPDVFAYNFAGYSGQFVLDHNKQTHHLTNKNGIISIHLDYENRQFTAIDKKGLKYILESREITKSSPTKKILWEKQFHGQTAGQTTENITAWFLSKIIGQNDTVEFFYNQKTVFYNTRISGSQTATWRGVPTKFEFPESNGELSETFSNSLIEQSSLVLSSIKNKRSGINIHFNSSSREDIDGEACKLDVITITMNNKDSISWNFKYSYFETQWTQEEYIYPEIHNALHKRLRLESIHNGNQKHTFSYYFEEANKLPPRNCYNGFDAWGYFNKELKDIEEVNDANKCLPNDINTGRCAFIEMCSPYNLGICFENRPIGHTIPLYKNGGDRSTNGEYAKALSLKSITYPTGGKTVFDYEPHMYTQVGNSTREPKFGGGIRISTITNHPIQGSILIKSFEYIGGVITADPIFCVTDLRDVEYKYGLYPQFSCNSEKAKLSLYTSNIVESTPYGVGITYRSVKENTSSGSIVYNYKTINDMNSNDTYISFIRMYDDESYGIPSLLSYYSYMPPFDVHLYSKNYIRGLQNSVTYYNSNGIKIRKDSFEYKVKNESEIFANKIFNLFKYDNEVDFPIVDANYLIMAYSHKIGQSTLALTTTTTYDIYGNNPIKEIKFHDQHPVYMTTLKESIIDSRNDTITYTYIYPFDNPQEYNLMIEQNLICKPTKRYKHINSSKVEETDYIYSKTSKFMDLSYTNTRYNGYSEAIKSQSIDIFDDYGNPLQTSKNNGNYTTYLWGYGHQYPIAEIQNATYEQVCNTIGIEIIERWSSSLSYTDSDISSISNLRSLFPSSLITTYTYKPLIGITSITNPRGITTYYEYNKLNKLEKILDFKKNIKKVYEYNYINK